MKNNTRGSGQTIKWLHDHAGYVGDDCLIWPFARNKRSGYGFFGLKRWPTYAHRFMCILAHGEPPTPEHQAAHTCGRGHEGCVNPRHLSWKTNSENQRDRRRHGTHLGGRGARTSLTPDQISEMRSLRGVIPVVQIAKKFSVSRGCVEYWHSHNRPPEPPGTSRSALRRHRIARAADEQFASDAK